MPFFQTRHLTHPLELSSARTTALSDGLEDTRRSFSGTSGTLSSFWALVSRPSWAFMPQFTRCTKTISPTPMSALSAVAVLPTAKLPTLIPILICEWGCDRQRTHHEGRYLPTARSVLRDSNYYSSTSPDI